MGKCTLSVASRASTGGKHQRARPFPACTPPTAPAHAQRASRRLQCRVRTCSAVRPRCFPAPPAASPPRAASAASPPGCQCARSWTQTASSRSPVRSHRAPRVHGQRQEPLPAHGAPCTLRPRPAPATLPLPCPAPDCMGPPRRGPCETRGSPGRRPTAVGPSLCPMSPRLERPAGLSAPGSRAAHARTHARRDARARAHTHTHTHTHTHVHIYADRTSGDVAVRLLPAAQEHAAAAAAAACKLRSADQDEKSQLPLEANCRVSLPGTSQKVQVFTHGQFFF